MPVENKGAQAPVVALENPRRVSEVLERREETEQAELARLDIEAKDAQLVRNKDWLLFRFFLATIFVLAVIAGLLMFGSSDQQRVGSHVLTGLVSLIAGYFARASKK